MESRIYSFAPVLSSASQILILGSIPGAKSLAMNQYYAHPQNQFWKIIFELLAVPYTTDYPQRIAVLQQHGIALWDVIESCERKGSLDATIKNEAVHNLHEVLARAPHIKSIYCNGQKSYQTTLKVLGKDFRLPIKPLPSTSPLHTIPYQEKLKVWQQILNDLG